MKLQDALAQLFTSLLFSSPAIAQISTPPVQNATSSACPSKGGVHIIAARGSSVRVIPGYGAIGAVKDMVLQRYPGSTAEYVEYPATLGNYTISETDGVYAMRKAINEFVSKCSSSIPLVVMGYSQGAQVTGDALVGQDDGAFKLNTSISGPLPVSTISRIAAVVLMGDPSFVTNETFHVGNATKNGIFPRHNVPNFNIDGLANRTRSYCDFNDPYCASGNISTGLHVHLGYIQEYGTLAENFIVGQINAFYANGTLASGGSGTTGTIATSPAPTAYTGSASGGWEEGNLAVLSLASLSASLWQL